MKLPNKLIVFSNPDKDGFQEEWYNGRKIGNLPHSFRLVCIAKPSSGKTNLIKNLLLHQKPPFERVLLWTQSKNSKEWDDVTHDTYEDCPGEEELFEELDEETHQPPKQVVIVEDIELENLSKENKTKLLQLLKHYSSHFNTSVILTVHDLIQIPANMRRCCNVYVLWKLTNATQKILGDRFNVDNKLLHNMCQTELKTQHDCIMIDMTKNTPYKFRKNVFKILDENDYLNYNNNIDNNKSYKNIPIDLFSFYE